MELRQLEYVVAVAEERHFGRAAARVHVTQQSVSEQVRRLERELGAPLFTRTSRRVALTEVGEVFLPEARRVVDAARGALDVGRRAARGTAELRVGYADELGTRIIGAVAAELSRRSSPIRLAPRPLSTPEQLTALLEHRLDVGVAWMPEPSPSLATVVVAREPVMAVLRDDDPLAAAPALDPAALSGRPLVLVPRSGNPRLHDRMLSPLVDGGARVVLGPAISGIDRALPVVLAGDAVALVVGRPVVRSPRVVVRPFAGPGATGECAVVVRRDISDLEVGALIDVVVELRDRGAFRTGEAPDG